MWKMRNVLIALVLIVFSGALYVGSAKAQMSSSAAVPILTWNTMFPVSGPFVNTPTTMNPIRGIPGGGKPWKIQGAQGQLLSDGQLDLRVNGLVFTATGTARPLTGFGVAVSCKTVNGSGMVTNVNMDAGPYPVNGNGDLTVSTRMMLPKVCVAPIVFVTSPNGGAWFAATGN